MKRPTSTTRNHRHALFKEARFLGFRRTYDCATRLHRHGIWIYERQIGDRLVTIQFWSDGNHRVSHMLNGRGSTLPTEFRRCGQMLRAVYRELTRTDHAPR